MKPTRSTFSCLVKAWLLCLLVALFSSVHLAAQTSMLPDPNGPDLAAVVFYKWYLGQLKQNKDPLHDEPVAIKRRVSAALLSEIEQKINSADGMEADYFIAAQDYLDDWPTHVSATIRDIKGAAATVEVQLGASTIKPYRLQVALIKAKGDWKIRKVSRD